MRDCIDHLAFCGKTCADCELEVDRHGNTEDQFEFCSFPDCGCDGARNCMAPSGASRPSLTWNIEKHRYAFEGHEIPERVKRVNIPTSEAFKAR